MNYSEKNGNNLKRDDMKARCLSQMCLGGQLKVVQKVEDN